MMIETETTTIINLQSLTPGSISYVDHPAMPNLAQVQQSKATETWCLIQDGKLGALCSLWTKNVTSVQGYKSAAVGHFFAQTPQAGAQILKHACERLMGLGFEYVVGPLDGDTWHSYRVVTEAGTAPPFFLEYYTPSDWPGIFAVAGFAQIATYRSSLAPTTNYVDRSAAKFATKTARLGLTLRPFNITNAEMELTALYALSIRSFAHNLLYAPIDLADFLALYMPLVPTIVPDLFLLAEEAGHLVGFVLAVPDYLQKARGEPIDTVVIKTVARHPQRRYAGLGSYLVREIHQRAATLGYSHAIHALMHDDNVSRVISDRTAQVIRRYTLYGRLLKNGGGGDNDRFA